MVIEPTPVMISARAPRIAVTIQNSGWRSW
jgi:hypothetical protein